jgi:UDP-N-acetylglucosamine 2-epimerase (non-hydrolysing)
METSGFNKHKTPILFIFGTRPEIIKLFVLYKVLKNSDEFYPILFNTGQQNMLNDILVSLGIECHYNAAEIPNRSSDLNQLISHLLNDFNNKFNDRSALSKKDIGGIIVQGDTASAYSGALWGFFNQIPIFHVEAGLRTFDRQQPFPEEFIRESIAKATTLHFCPTSVNYDNLRNEGVNKDSLNVVGNTINDAMLTLIDENLIKYPQEDNFLLSTLHRRENWDNVSKYAVILNNLIKKHDYYSNIFHLLHPNPMIKRTFETVLNGGRNVKLKLKEPIHDYFEMLGYVKSSSCILTDSGGLQEESLFFNIPCGVLREKTERPEVLDVNAKLLPFEENKVSDFLDYAKQYKNENKSDFNYTYGKGETSKEIYSVLKKYFHFN